MFSKRLREILDLLPTNITVLADIGTDHAFLPIQLVQEKTVEKVYAIDVNQQPLVRAKKNIQKAKLEHKIFPLLADGLDFLKVIEDSEIDYCIIAGLGAKTIFNILSKDSSRIKNYIIAANTEIKILHQWVNKKRYKIAFEKFLVEDNHHYWVLWISKTVFQKCKNVEFGDFFWHQKNRDYQSYLQHRLELNQKILQQLEKTNNQASYQKFATKNKRIREYLKQWNY